MTQIIQFLMYVPIFTYMTVSLRWLVRCCLTSHSAIFPLNSGEALVLFPNVDMLPSTQRHVRLRVFSVPSIPRHGHRDVRRCISPACHQRATRGEDMPRIEPRSTDSQSSPLPLRQRGGHVSISKSVYSDDSIALVLYLTDRICGTKSALVVITWYFW